MFWPGYPSTFAQAQLAEPRRSRNRNRSVGIGGFSRNNTGFVVSRFQEWLRKLNTQEVMPVRISYANDRGPKIARALGNRNRGYRYTGYFQQHFHCYAMSPAYGNQSTASRNIQRSCKFKERFSMSVLASYEERNCER